MYQNHYCRDEFIIYYRITFTLRNKNMIYNLTRKIFIQNIRKIRKKYEQSPLHDYALSEYNTTV